MPILFLTHHAPHDLRWCQTNWTELSCLEVFGGPLMWQREILAEWLSLNADSIPCWTKFRISMQPEFWCSLFIQVQVSDNHEVRKWTFVFSKSTLWQSCSQKLDVLKWQQLRSSQSGWFLRQSWCHEPGSPLSFHVTFSDKHAVRISAWALQTHNFRFLGPEAFGCHES